MRPLTVITGILLGTSLSIAFSLAAVLVIYAVIGDENPRLSQELGPLLASFSLFIALTVVSGLSFYTLLKHHRARWYAQAGLWTLLVATGFYFWP